MATKFAPSAKTLAARQRALDLIEQAQRLLWKAREVASPLQGWAEEKPRGPYYLIGDHASATNALWHQVNNAPEPTGHDHDGEEPASD